MFVLDNCKLGVHDFMDYEDWLPLRNAEKTFNMILNKIETIGQDKKYFQHLYIFGSEDAIPGLHPQSKEAAFMLCNIVAKHFRGIPIGFIPFANAIIFGSSNPEPILEIKRVLESRKGEC